MSHALYETTEPYYPARDHGATDFNEYLMPGLGNLANIEIRVIQRPAPDGPYGPAGHRFAVTRGGEAFSRRAAEKMCLSISLLSRKLGSTASMKGRLSNTRKSRTGEKHRQRT